MEVRFHIGESGASPSPRKAWIETPHARGLGERGPVAFPPEGVD